MDSAPVNSLSRGTRAGITAGIKAVMADKSVVGVIIRGAGRAFCAGAEITELSGAPAGKSLQDDEPLTEMMMRMENLPIPVVAVVHGFALGGGMEVALSCHYRLATKDAQFGLPEVNLGLLPGAGGTQRLPRVIGAAPALEAILSGAPMKADKALKLGVCDAVLSGKDEASRLQEALQFIATKLGKPRPVGKMPVPDAAEAKAKLPAILKAAQTKRKGEKAPVHIYKCVVAAIEAKDLAAGMKEEARLFVQLLASSEARALQHVFFAERAAAKLPKRFQAEPAPIKKVGIIGAGTMGGGIAMSCADVGMDVVLIDATQEFLDRGLKVIAGNYKRSVERQSITAKQMEERLARIQPSLDYGALSQVDLVVEAVFEDMKLKKDIFARLDKVCKPGCILASNTSGLDIDQIASATSRPGDVVGCHFFSPANVMKLLENVFGKASSPRTVATAMDFGRRIGKIPCLVGNCPGFVGNRMLGPYSKEAEKLALEGAPVDRIDRVIESVFGMNMGPFKMNDLVGLDLFWRKRKTEGKHNPNVNVEDALCDAGRFGQKNGKGFYVYEDGRTAKPDPFTEGVLERIAAHRNIDRRPSEKISDNEIIERLVYPLINEGFKCLEENIASKSSDIDIIYCFGYGFPRWRGGPMKYAEEVGLDTILAGLEKYRRWGQREDHWTPSALLVKTVTEQAHKKAKPAAKL